jgi:hypothetical protein
MSMYNMVFGVSPAAPLLMAALNLKAADVGRFRDCYLTDAGEIAVYTRNGGGNRDDYQDVFDALEKHPQYLRDEDDDFDCTYATIYFSVPDTLDRDALAAIAPEMKRDEAWQVFLETLRRMPTKSTEAKTPAG